MGPILSFSQSINIWCVLQVQINNLCGSLKSIVVLFNLEIQILKSMDIMGLCQIYVYRTINGSIISRKSKNLSKNAMSEVHFSTKNLQPFAGNYRSTANPYNFY